MKRMLFALSAVVSLAAGSNVQANVQTNVAPEEAARVVKLRVVNNTSHVLNVDQESMNFSLLNLLGGAPQLASYEVMAQVNEAGDMTHRNSVKIPFQTPGTYLIKGNNGTYKIVFDADYKGSLIWLGIGANLNYPADLETLAKKSMDKNFVKKHRIKVTRVLGTEESN